MLVWKQLEATTFRWPGIVGGAVRLTPVEFAALFDGIDWRRVQATREIPTPSVPASTLRAMLAAAHDTPDLPDDAAALRTLLLEARVQIGTLVAERDALAEYNERLQHLLLKLKRRQFGTKSERLPDEQLLFAFEEIEATLAANAAEAGKASPALHDN